MKLKKIASLMLAGVMAVSMLAGCNTTSNNQPNVPNVPEEPTTSNVTQSVLDKTSEALQKKLSVYDDTKLDQAVAFAAANNVYESFANTLKVLNANGSFVTDASTIMKGGDIQAYSARACFKTSILPNYSPQKGKYQEGKRRNSPAFQTFRAQWTPIFSRKRQ